MEELCGGFFDSVGTPRMGGKSAWETGARSRSATVAVMPAADDQEEPKEEIIKEKPATTKESEILGLSSPIPQAPPTRRVTWAGQDNFRWTEEPSRFFPDDACSDSSSASAEDDDRSESSGSVSSELAGTDIDGADRGVDEVIKNRGDCIKEVMAALNGVCLTLENVSGTVQMEEAGSSAVDEEEQSMSSAEQFVAVRELVDDPATGAAIVDKAPRWAIGHRMAVIVVALAFVLGMVIGFGVHDHRAATSLSGGVFSTAVTLYIDPTTETLAERNPDADTSDLGSDAEIRYLGRTAAAVAAAPVGTLTSQISSFSGQTASTTTKAVDEIGAQIQAVRRMRITREVLEEVQDTWIEVTSTAAQGGPAPGLLDGPGPGAPDFLDVDGSPPTIVLHAPVGWFAKSLDRLTRNYRPGFEGLMNGPWV